MQTFVLADDLESRAWGQVPVRPLSRAEYEFMVAQGFFDEERVELLEGVLVAMSPQGVSHADVITRLNRLLVFALGDRADVRPQCPLATSDYSEPEPDFAVVPAARERRGDAGHPRTAHLVIEVAETSLRRDRGLKAKLYALAGVPEYWVVNLVDEVIEVFTGPEDGAYRSATTNARGEAIALVAFPGVTIAVADVL